MRATGRIGRALLLLLLSLPLAGCPSVRPLEEPVREPVADLFVHGPSGMAFPAAVGPFTREAEVTRYDEDGRDVSMGYNLLDPRRPVIATVYVYPAPRTFSLGGSAEDDGRMRRDLEDGERRGRIAEVLRAHPGTEVIREEPFVLGGQGEPRPGWKVVFRYDQRREKVVVPMLSHMVLFCFVEGDWIVKFRFTHPRTLDATEAIDGFLRDLEWTLHGE